MLIIRIISKSSLLQYIFKLIKFFFSKYLLCSQLLEKPKKKAANGQNICESFYSTTTKMNEFLNHYIFSLCIQQYRIYTIEKHASTYKIIIFLFIEQRFYCIVLIPLHLSSPTPKF